MDFARRQLEKYGWTDGKGLGKHENGISKALKPKLKRSVTGVGHDPASDFTEHWWSTLYDKAAGNIEVEEKNGKTKRIKRKDNGEFEITNSTWRLKKKHKHTTTEEQYSGFFIKTAVLANGGSKTEKLRETESDDEKDKSDVVKMTDEELFAACEGRTAHKGARHGLKALGKLARIEQQEEMLLNQPKYKGYSHAKNKEKISINDLQVVEDMNLNSDVDVKEPKKKKKKRKRCVSHENVHYVTENDDIDMAESEVPLPVENITSTSSEAVTSAEDVIGTKKIKKSRKNMDNIMDQVEVINNISKSKKKKRHKSNIDLVLGVTSDSSKSEDNLKSDFVLKSKKKKLS